MLRRRDGLLVRTGQLCALAPAACIALAACSPEEAPPREPSPVAEAAAASTGGRAAAYVEPEILARFARVPRQVVIVELRREDGDANEGGPSAAGELDAEAARSRAAARRAKTATLLADVAASPGRPAVRHAYPSFGMVALDATKADVDWLARRPEVRRLHADRERAAHTASSIPFTQLDQWQAAGQKGAGVAVAVLDTPVEYAQGSFGPCAAPGAAGCAVKAWESFAAGTDPAALMAKAHHGTNVAGIVHAAAPDASILGLNVFHWDDQLNEARCFDSDVIAALQWVADHQADYPIVAANLSLGSPPSGSAPCNDSAYYEPLRALHHDHDVVAVISSGNDAAVDAVGYPGCVSLATTVGAELDTELFKLSGGCTQSPKHAGEIACFTNIGGALDVVAPGVHVTAGGQTFNGTSQAAPHVAGAAAVVQAYQLKNGGKLESAYWLQKDLLSLTVPVPWQGTAFASLRMKSGFHYDRAWGFGGWYKDDPAGVIPKAPKAFTRTFVASGVGFTIESAYLYLEILHDAPEALTVTLTGPTGKQASFSLPAGLANYTGVVGRTWLPGALDALAGSPADGTWTVSVTDGGGAKTGHFLDAAVYFVKSGCVGKCVDAACGDDGCGGACDRCLIEGACWADGTKDPANACLACDASKSATAWSPLTGTTCDDGNGCTKSDVCKSGACVGGDPVECTAADDCHTAGVCDKKTGKCSSPKAKDGKACDDGDACTKKDACKAGVCVGADPVECAGAGPCDESASCDAKSGACTALPRADGTGCDDGDGCTVGDACTAGVCGGSRRACPPKDACHVAGTCSSGACVDVAAADGAPCAGGACAAGVCKAGAAPTQAGGLAPSEDAGGCGCRVAGERRDDGALALAVVAALGAFARRRRRPTSA